MADEDISLTEDQLLENLDESNNGESEFLNENEVSIENNWFWNVKLPSEATQIFGNVIVENAETIKDGRC